MRTEARERCGHRKVVDSAWRVLAVSACVLAAAASGALGQEAPAACVEPDSPLRLDHVPIAVGDLDALSRRLTDEFGFHVRGGRRDAHGLETAEIGFGDGTRLELRTVRGLVDPDADATEVRRYAELIADGGGGAYLALSGTDGAGLDDLLAVAWDVETDLAAAGSGAGRRAAFPPDHPLHAVFLVDPGRARPEPTAPPEPAAPPEHPNGARGLQAAWVMVEDPERLTRFLLAFGARDCGPSRHPEHLYGRAVGIRGGTVYVVDARLWMADPGSAPVVSLTVRGGPESVSDNIVLGSAGGLWIELRPSDAGNESSTPDGSARLEKNG